MEQGQGANEAKIVIHFLEILQHLELINYFSYIISEIQAYSYGFSSRC